MTRAAEHRAARRYAGGFTSARVTAPLPRPRRTFPILHVLTTVATLACFAAFASL